MQEGRQDVVQALDVTAAGVGAGPDVQNTDQRSLEGTLAKKLDCGFRPRRIDRDLAQRPELLGAVVRYRAKRERIAGSVSGRAAAVASTGCVCACVGGE